jgi:hypothetical protein
MAVIGGAFLAIDKVGQRDTRWLNPLTVSGRRQGEEGASQISSACSYPTAASAFSFYLGFPASILISAPLATYMSFEEVRIIPVRFVQFKGCIRGFEP